MRHLDFFNHLANRRIQSRKKHAYYWNDITQHCDYFIHPESSVLEIGCGCGELINAVSGKRKLGLDFSPAMIQQAKEQYPGIEFQIMDAEALTISEPFDVIIISNTIGYLNDVQKVFEGLHKVSHPKTKIFITYYNYMWQPILKLAEVLGLKQKMPPQNWLTQKDIGNLLYLAGFDMFNSSKSLLLPINIPIISLLVNRYLAKLPLINSCTLNTFCIARPIPNVDYSEEEANEQHSVSVIIPARNESGNIENAVLRTPEFGKSVELIFIEGNSTDDTWSKIQEIAEKYQTTHTIQIGRQEGKGKGDAVRKGFDMATGDILMILDADLTVPPEDLPKFYTALVSGKGEFINGSRLVYAMEKQAMRFLNILGNKFFSVAFSWLLGQPFKDTLCGTKVLFKKDYTKIRENRSYFGDFDPFGDYDLIFGAHKLNLKITELPIVYQQRVYGATNISRFKHGLILLRMCLFAAKKIKFK